MTIPFVSRDEKENSEDKSTDDSENEYSRPMKPEPSPDVVNNVIDDTKVELIDHNWSFLKAILPEHDIETIEH